MKRIKGIKLIIMAIVVIFSLNIIGFAMAVEPAIYFEEYRNPLVEYVPDYTYENNDGDLVTTEAFLFSFDPARSTILFDKAAPDYLIWRAIGHKYPDTSKEPYAASTADPDCLHCRIEFHDRYIEPYTYYCYVAQAIQYHEDEEDMFGVIIGVGPIPETAKCFRIDPELAYKADNQDIKIQLKGDGTIEYCAEGKLYVGTWSDHSNAAYTHDCNFDGFKVWLIIGEPSYLVQLKRNIYTGEYSEMKRYNMSKISSFGCGSGPSTFTPSEDGALGGCFMTTLR